MLITWFQMDHRHDYVWFPLSDRTALTLRLLELAHGLQPIVLVITMYFSARQIKFVGAPLDFFPLGFVEANGLVV